MWRNRHGDSIESAGLRGELIFVALSPDERSVAVTLRDPQTGRMQLHILDLARRVLTCIGPAEAIRGSAAWSPDSQRLALRLNTEGRNALYVAAAADPHRLDLIANVDASDVSTNSWSPDDRFVYAAATPAGWSLWAVPVN